MKKMRLSLLATLFCFTLSAQHEKSLLWEISGPGLAKPSYVFGTIHLICPQDFQLSEALKTRLAAVDQLYLELDFDDPNLRSQMQQGMVMTDGTTLKSLLSAGEYARMDTFLQEKLGAGADALGILKPFALLSALYGPMIGCQPESYERALVRLATEQKKDILGLESVAEQLAIFDSIPLRDQASMVLDMVQDMPGNKALFEQLVGHYKTGDLEALTQLMATMEADMPGASKVLLSDRNHRWTPEIIAIAKLKPTLFAVGAGHLGGADGVLRLLVNRGFTVKPVF